MGCEKQVNCFCDKRGDLAGAWWRPGCRISHDSNGVARGLEVGQKMIRLSELLCSCFNTECNFEADGAWTLHRVFMSFKRCFLHPI